jgi:tetratricopeptide (TPR) repeat protein
MSVRRVIHRSLVVFGIVVGTSFGYGVYLARVHRGPFKQPAAATPAADVGSLLRSGSKYLETKHAEQALIAYRQAMTLDPRSIGAQLGVARGELMAGRESIAAQEYERVLLLDRQNTIALRQLARIYSHESQTWGQSESKYRELLRVDAGDGPAQLELARVLAWQRKSRESVEIFSRDAVRRLMRWQDQKDYAFALVRAGHADTAEPVLKKLLSTRSNDSEIKLQLAALYASRRDWDMALPLYEALLRNNPNDLRLNLTYGLGLLSTKRYKAALMPLEKARRGMPGSADTRLAYARALKGNGDLKKAAQEFRRVASTSLDPAILREYADLVLEKHDYREAEKAYKQALGLGLRDTRLLMGLAGALRGNGKHREAVPYLREAYAKQPSDRVAFELASALQKSGQHKEALSLLAKIETPAR